MSTHLTSTASVAATESGDDAHTSPYAPLRTVTLNSGYSIPIIAYGTGTAQAWTDTSVPVATALKSGLVHLDTAWHYKNHTSTAEGIKRSGLTREQVFVTTKGGSFDDAPEEGDVRRWLEASLKDLELDYVDLYLIHAEFHVESVVDSWKAMEQIQRDGLARSIGISNFSTKSLQVILNTCTIKPAVNQIEFHPYALPTYLPTLLPLCKEHDILIQSYAPLMSVVRHPGGPVDSTVDKVRTERGLGETAGQILLQWAQQITGGVVVTTTAKPERMTEQVEPFLADSSLPPLSGQHLTEIATAGAAGPYRHWGINWPYFTQGEGGIDVAPEGASWRTKPATRHDLAIVASS